MELLGERWTLLILRELLFGPRRFSDLRAELPGISAKILTERLSGMEANGILRRVALTEPAPVQLFQLTPWGMAAEPIVQEMGRWAAASPMHDSTLPLSAASFMMSLRTMLDRNAARGLAFTAAFTIGTSRFTGRLEQCRLEVLRGLPDDPQIALKAAAASRLAALFYGNMTSEAAGVQTCGTIEDVARFLSLFHLPPKVPYPD
ncbi:winged helix-turn-helix transcriptional regulator [Paracoccus beibuensis]|uniref:winged helix-turn-helix transcriptional regulator n=1 Tax=Paracoccus beibuensis TaxID=547602 RepID=UPI0022401DB6|nr:helix-turn-helix domain-containing protein [Paracoccus beibuensis]